MPATVGAYVTDMPQAVDLLFYMLLKYKMNNYIQWLNKWCPWDLKTDSYQHWQMKISNVVEKILIKLVMFCHAAITGKEILGKTGW
jgi:hypothetical protein